MALQEQPQEAVGPVSEPQQRELVQPLVLQERAAARREQQALRQPLQVQAEERVSLPQGLAGQAPQQQEAARIQQEREERQQREEAVELRRQASGALP